MKQKRFVWLVLALATILSLVVVAPGLTAAPDSKVRVWVEYQPGSKPLVDRLLARAGAEFHYTFDDLNSFVVTISADQLARLKGDRNVVMVEEDAKRYLDSQTVPYGIDMVQARDVWDANRDGTIDAGAPTGANRLVCVIDSGLYTGHEDIQGINVVGGYPSNWNTDSCGHGTHVVGTIAAVNNQVGVVGVTPGTVSLYIVKVFGDNCAWTYASTLADAANRCSSAGAKVISMSLGGSVPNLQENRTFQNLDAAGILSIAAAGNTGANENHYPASYASVMGVAAVDQNKQWATFSTYNSDVEIAAPGVGVLSTVPYLDVSTLTVDGVAYDGNHVEYAARGSASGALVDGGLCGSAGSWAGKVVLCQRGTYDFYTKVMSVQNGGGVAAVLYNNVSGNFSGTLGDGNSSTIPAISLSLEDGQYLVANKLGLTGTVNSSITWNVSAYEYYDGTSMATPHVSAAAALVWSWNTSLTNTQIRSALKNSAEDLGTAGRDNYYGYGLVQAYAAWVYLGGGTPDTPPVVSVTAPAEGATVSSTVDVSATATDDKGVTQVQFYVDTALIGTDTNGSDGWTASWNTTSAANGTHVVKAVATDTIGQTGQDTNNVTVNNPVVDTPPTVTVTAPAEGATVSGTVTVTATATDDKGVTQVAFFVDGNSIGTDTNSSDGWSVAWLTTAVADGSHVVKAVATDTIGQTGEDSNTVTVNNSTPTLTMHVGDLTGTASGSLRWTATVTITVHNASHQPLAGVTVTGNWSNGATGTSTCTTNSAGQCTVTKSNIQRKTTSVTFTVTNLTLTGWVYDSGANEKTSVTVTR